MNRPEDSLHHAVVQLLKLTAAAGVIYYHPANEGTKSAIRGARLKRKGVLAGVADLALILPGGRAAFLELKAPKTGRLNENQKAFREACEATGAPYAVATTLDEAQAVLTSWGALGYREVPFQ